MFKFVLSLICVLITYSALAQSVPDNNEVRLEYHELTLNTLIKYGYCKAENDCSDKQLMLSRRTRNGFSVTSYGITNQEAISDLEVRLRELHEKYEGNFEMGYSAIKENHKLFVNTSTPPKATILFTVKLPKN